MFSALSADLKWRIVPLGSLIHSLPLLGWYTKGLGVIRQMAHGHDFVGVI
ncbi:hypothetical protein ACIPZ8_26385 [Pseudomonas sp. NPDC089422]